MKITVQRTGGIAAMNRVWTVDAVTPDDKQRWMPILDACPWDTATARASRSAAQPDRFTYSIRAGQRRATLPEQSLTGPWRVLVDSAKAEGRQTRGR